MYEVRAYISEGKNMSLPRWNVYAGNFTKFNSLNMLWKSGAQPSGFYDEESEGHLHHHDHNGIVEEELRHDDPVEEGIGHRKPAQQKHA